MGSDPAQLTSLSLTHVYYNPHDPVSYVCAWLALLPQGLCIVYATLVWSTREAEVALAFAGQLGCEAVNFALKRLIKAERPRHGHYTLFGLPLGGYDESFGGTGDGNGSDYAHLPFRRGYGMPSSHAQFAGYWAITIALFLLVRYRPVVQKAAAAAAAATVGTTRKTRVERTSPASTNTATTTPRTPRTASLSRAERVVISALAFVLALLIAWSRVYLHYHTPIQVVVGFTAGLAVGVAWFVATGLVRQWGLLDWALDLPPARWLRIRDLAVEEDVLQAGWERWQEKQAARETAKNK